MKPTYRIKIVAVALGLVLPASAVLIQLHRSRWNPSVLETFGSLGKSAHFVSHEYPDAYRIVGWGHDGASFYVISREFPHLHAAAVFLDYPANRLRRILVPALLHFTGGRRPYSWGLLSLDVLAIGALILALTTMLEEAGLPLLAAAAVGISPGIILAMELGLVDLVALAFSAWGVALSRRKPWPSVLLLTSAVLTRETALLAVLAVLLTRRRLLFFTPLVVLAAWSIYLARAFPGTQQTELALPFTQWLYGKPLEMISAGLFLLGSLVCAWYLRGKHQALAVWLALQALTLPIMVRDVMSGGNFARVVALAPFAMVVALTLVEKRSASIPLQPESDVST